MKRVSQTTQFSRDVKRMRKRGKDLRKLQDVVRLLAAGTALPQKHMDHPLIGPWFPYSTDKANWLFLLSIADGAIERYDVPHHEKGSHGAALGADGNLYTVTHEGGLHRFRVRERRWETLPHRLSAGITASRTPFAPINNPARAKTPTA